MEPIDPVYGTATLLLIAAAAVALLLTLIMVLKLHAFVALVLVSVVTRIRSTGAARGSSASSRRTAPMGRCNE